MLLSLGLDTQTILESISKDPLLCTTSERNEEEMTITTTTVVQGILR